MIDSVHQHHIRREVLKPVYSEKDRSLRESSAILAWSKSQIKGNLLLGDLGFACLLSTNLLK